MEKKNVDRKDWKRGLEQSAAYQWTQGVLKEREKVTESKSQLSFFLSNEETVDTVNDT